MAQDSSQSQPQSPEVQKVTSDPNFLALEVSEQEKVLDQIDPNFKALDRIARNQVLAHFQSQTHPTGLNPSTQRELSRPGRGLMSAADDISGLIAAPFALGREVAKHPIQAPIKLAKEFVAQPYRELIGNPQPGEDPNTYVRPNLTGRAINMLSSLMGGNPQAAREAYRSGDVTGAYTHLLTTPLFTFGLGKTLGSMEKPVSATRREVSSLQSLSRGAVQGGGPVDAAERMAEMQRVLKQVMAREGITDETLRRELPIRERAGQADLVGDVAHGNQRVLDLARRAVGFTHEPIDAVMSRFGRQPAGPLPARIAKGLRAEAAEIGKVNDSLAKAINDVADKIEQAKSYSDLNDIKSHANKMLDEVYSPVPGRAIDATAERAYAYKLAADAVRTEMYPELQRISGSSLDLAKLGQREADAINLRDGIFEHYYREVAPEQASKEAHTFLEYTLAGSGAPGHSFYSRHILSRGLEKKGVIPTAGAEFNRQFSRGAGPIGKGIKPERVVATMRNVPQLLGSTEPFRFTISGDLPQEVIAGKGIVPAKRVHVGTKEVVGSAEGAATDTALFQQARRELGADASVSDIARRAQELKAAREPNYLRQRSELGTAIGTVPERIRGRRTPEQIRRQQLGESGSAVPERLFTGPMSHKEDQWQFLTSGTEAGETSTISGAGTMYTSSVETAENTLRRLRAFAQRPMPRQVADRVRTEIASLEKQLQRYRAYEGHGRPTDIKIAPYKAGTTPRFPRAGRKAGIAARGASAAQGVVKGMTPPPTRPYDEDEEPPE